MTAVVEIPSLARPSADELAELPHRLARELAWNATSHRYETAAEIAAGVQQGGLSEFINTSDIARIRRFDIHAPGRTPYLSPVAHRVARLLGRQWRNTLATNYGIVRPELRLAITSMVRSQDYQDTIVADGRLAWPHSTHATGNTFDIDNSGYYEVTRGGQLHPVINPNRDVAVDNQLHNYDPDVMEAALTAAQALHNAGVINLVHEFSNTPNACLHIAANPSLVT